jgi:hypothetical protein
MQGLQDPYQNNVDNLNNIRWEPSRYFRNEKREYLKGKLTNMKQTVTRIASETCIGPSMNLRRVTSLELI